MLFEKKGMSTLNYYLILRFFSCLNEFRFNYVIRIGMFEIFVTCVLDRLSLWHYNYFSRNILKRNRFYSINFNLENIFIY